MSPRSAPSRHDLTAQQFLKAAVRLIDAYLEDDPQHERPARLRSIHFPAALDWLRTEDVIRLAASDNRTGASRKAFFNRWPTRDEFLPDAIIYALVYDRLSEDSKENARQMPTEVAEAESFSSALQNISDNVLRTLQRHPRNYLTLHIGPLLPQHPSLWAALIPSMQKGNESWAEGYAALLHELGLELRPGWSPYRLALALQAILDGFLLRYRIQPGDYTESLWEGAGIFADTVLATVLGVIDTDRSRSDVKAELNKLIGR